MTSRRTTSGRREDIEEEVESEGSRWGVARARTVEIRQDFGE
jgi:hypothetical protein